jgi:hypothetical protein
MVWTERRYTMSRIAKRYYVNPFKLVFLLIWINSRTLPIFFVELTKIVLLSREGMSDTDIGKALLMSQDTVGTFRTRYKEHGVEGFLDYHFQVRARLSKSESPLFIRLSGFPLKFPSPRIPA